MLLGNRLPPLEAVLLIAVIVFSPVVITYVNNIKSDIAFMSLSTLSLLSTDRFVCWNREEPASLIKNAALGAAIFLAFFIRAIGILLLIMLLACQIIALYPHLHKQYERKRMLINFLVPYLVFGILWGISAILFPASQGSMQDSLALIKTSFPLGLLKDHAWFYLHWIDQIFLIGLPGPLIVYGFLLAFFVIGIIAGVEKDYAFIIYSALTIPVLLIYPGLETRYAFPISLFFCIFHIRG